MNLNDLAERPMWVAWQIEDRAGKPTKMPYGPNTGRLAKSNDSTTWATREEAQKRAVLLPKPQGVSGVGIMMSPIDPFHLGGVDLDACRNEQGEIDPWALEIIKRFASYTEVSPSNKGVKIFFLYDPTDIGTITSKTVRRRENGGDKDPGIEFYVSNRYFTVTGRPIDDKDDLRIVLVEDMKWLLEAIIPNFAPKPGAKAKEDIKFHIDDTRAAFEIIPNNNLSWEEWNTKAMALFTATNGSPDGFAIFDKWSRKADLYDEASTRERWDHFKRSPPNRSTAGSIVFWVREVEPDWVPPHNEAQNVFIREKKGAKRIIANQANLRLALSKLGIVLSYDMFSQRALIQGPNGQPKRYMDDDAQNHVYLLIDDTWGFRAAREYFYMFLKNEAMANSFHPVKDYLNNLVWDEETRVDKWLLTYAGVEDSPYIRAIGKIVLVAAVRRIRQPGCKFDEMIVLESPQGLDKSSSLAALAVNEEWFSDGLPLDADDKQALEVMRGKWIMEAPELKGMKKGDIEHLKAFLSRQVDRARMAYGRDITERPRQCIIIGTTNSDAYLRDTTGNRRFWPVKINRLDIKAIRRDRNQLWAEAAKLEADGESIRLDPKLYKDAAVQQEGRFIDDPWTSLLDVALADFQQGKILAADIWTFLDIPTGVRNQEHNARMGEAMRKLGWTKRQLRYNAKVMSHYTKGGRLTWDDRIHMERDRETGKLNIYAERETTKEEDEDNLFNAAAEAPESVEEPEGDAWEA